MTFWDINGGNIWYFDSMIVWNWKDVSYSWFYTSLDIVVMSYRFEPSHIWNIFETRVQATKRNGTLKVVAKKDLEMSTFKVVTVESGWP
jgi:hypothetical protein